MSAARTDLAALAGRGSGNDALDASAWNAVLRDPTPSPRWLREQERAHVCAPLGQKGEARELVETAASIPEYEPEDAAAAANARFTKLEEAVSLASNKMTAADRGILRKYAAAARAGRPLNKI